MLNSLLTFVNDYAPGLATKKTLLAVSGGVDSMVMAELFHRAGFSFAIAHCNFGLRGTESDGDENLVRLWAKQHNVDFYVEDFPTAKKAKAEGVSIQMAARDLRYAWFEKLVQELGYDYLATAHHADDNIETVLLNLTRGTGLPGLLGIAPVKGQLVRPMLFVAKREILDFAQKEDLEWREDSSNATEAYRRNLLRHRVLPVLKAINPALHKTFNQNLERFRAVDSIVDEWLEQWQQKALRSAEGTIYVSIPIIQQAREPIWLLHEILQEFGFNYTQTKQIVATLDGISGKQFLSVSHSLTKDRQDLIVEPLPLQDIFQPVFIQKNSDKVALPGKAYLEVKRVQPLPNLDFGSNGQVAYLDAVQLCFPLQLRPWQAGDWLQPFGMGGKSKKVSDLLVDGKVPMNRKKDCLVLLDDNQSILWVLGLRTDERFKVNPETTEILRFEIFKI